MVIYWSPPNFLNFLGARFPTSQERNLAVPGTKYTNLAIGAIGASKSLEAPVIEPRPINLNINTIKPHYTILTDMLPQTNCIEFKGSNIHFNL